MKKREYSAGVSIDICARVRGSTSVVFVVGLGDSTINLLPVRRRFLLDRAGVYVANMLINNKAGSNN